MSAVGIYIGEVLTSKSMDFAVLGLVFLGKSKVLMGFIYLDTSYHHPTLAQVRVGNVDNFPAWEFCQFPFSPNV